MVLVTLALASCGSSPSGMTAAAFCAQEREQTAAFSARCLGGSATDWKAYRDAYVPCSRFEELIAGGTVRYHPELAADCLKANSADRDCATPENFCFASTFEGLVPTGAPCRNDYECPPNAACWVRSELGLNTCAQSVCIAVGVKQGDSCADLPFCYPGIAVCVNGTCEAFAVEGDPCGGVDQPSCGPGLRCDPTNGCAPLAAGSLCNSDFDCLGTEFCDGSQCRPRIEVGASCNGAPHGCVGWAACNTQNFVCEAAGHVGQPCGSTMGDESLCIGGACQLSQTSNPNACVPLKQDGEPCQIGSECASGGCDAGLCKTCH
jgi:hypothetical protein